VSIFVWFCVNPTACLADAAAIIHTAVHEVLDVTQEELLWVNYYIFKWCRECVHVQGEHFQQLL
jgi:hypothetical protein